MPIVSLSLNEKIIEEMDKMQHKLGFSGRSEFVRSAIRSFVTEKSKETLEDSDSVTATIIMVVPDSQMKNIHEISHDFSSIITSNLHQHLGKERCLDIFTVKGSGREIKKMVRALEQLPKVEDVKLLVSQ